MSAPRLAGQVAFVAALLATLAAPCTSFASGVSVRFDFSSPDRSPFPNDVFTRADLGQITYRRVALPRPDCGARPSDCADIDLLNELDGFNTQPRITIPFTGPIDLSTVSSSSLYLLCVGDVRTGAGAGARIGINQVVWDPATNTLAFESDRLLAQHTRYLIMMTSALRDRAGDRIGIALAASGLKMPLAGALATATAAGSAASGETGIPLALFTTQSVTADLEKITAQLKAARPAPATFMIGDGGRTRAVFPVSTVSDLQFQRQTGTAPAFTLQRVPVAALGIVPGAVGTLAYGRYRSPDYETPAKFIPATPTATGQPRAQAWNDIVFQLFLPAGARPAAGWPVAIFGHGFTDSLYGDPWTVASIFAARGIASIGINVVGHGGGPLGTLNILRPGAATVVIPAGGRGVDQNGDGLIDAAEGVSALPPRIALDSRDGLRQTVVDLMQLVRVIQVGVDVDGDGTPDLDPRQISYVGQSFGGIYGTMLMAVEPDIRAAVLNVAGGSVIEVARLGYFRPLLGQALAFRLPSLINVSDPSGITFDENLPLRDEPPRVNTVAGAIPIQAALERFEWAQGSGNPAAYAPFLRTQPLPGRRARPVLFQLAKGDETVPNPTNSAILRAGALTDRTTFFRNDLAYALNPAVDKDPHIFLTNVANPATLPYAVAAQTQVAEFFASGGASLIDPDDGGPIFETPIAGPLPEGLNFLP